MLFSWKAGVDVFGGKLIFPKFVENLFNNLRHFLDFFAVFFDTTIASVKSTAKSQENVENCEKISRQTEGKKHTKKH